MRMDELWVDEQGFYLHKVTISLLTKVVREQILKGVEK